LIYFFLKFILEGLLQNIKGGGENIVKNFANLLKEYDLKVTPQRVAIVQEFHKYGHMNIDDLYKNLLDRFPSVSLATIYKNINSMIEKVFLQELKIPNSKTFYELAKNEHYLCIVINVVILKILCLIIEILLNKFQK